MAMPRSRPRGREIARPPAGGVATEHAAKIYGAAVASVVVIVAFLALTSAGHVIDAATQHFMLFYAGVFTLITLCGSVALGLIATDRMVLHPGHRIFVQSAHRAASFGALAFLLIHIATEILAQRVHLLDSLIPFLSPYRTFYIGLGTIASDLILLIVITGILRKRFTSHGKAWRWRAIHYTSYLAFVFGVWHGLLGGRPGKPYVDWSYGFVVAFVALGLAVRILANSLRPKETLSGPPVPESAGSGSAPMRAASMFAQLGVVRAATSTALLAQSGPQPMLSAPVGDWNARDAAGMRPAIAALPAAGAPYGYQDERQPYYEPGYEGPPRYLGAPRADSGPMRRADSGPMPRVPGRQGQVRDSGPMPRVTTGPMPQAPGSAGQWATGSMPRAAGGPMPKAGGGPMPRVPGRQGQVRDSGPMPRVTTGPMPQASGPAARPATGPDPRAANGAMRRAANGAKPRGATGPIPNGANGPVQGRGGPLPSAMAGRMPNAGTGPTAEAPYPVPRSAAGAAPRAATGPMPRSANGPMPRAAGTGPGPGGSGGRRVRPGGSQPRGGQAGSGQPGSVQPGPGRNGARSARGQAQPAGSGWAGAAGWAGPQGPAAAPDWAGAQDWTWEQDWIGSQDWSDGQDLTGGQDWSDGQDWAGEQGWTGAPGWTAVPDGRAWNSGQPPWEGGVEPPSFRYREPGPGMPGYRGPRDAFYGGDDLP